jgi:hypothetical protein
MKWVLTTIFFFLLVQHLQTANSFIIEVDQLALRKNIFITIIDN